jgi:cysteine synthase
VSDEDANDNVQVTVKANNALVSVDKAKTSKVHTKGKGEEIVDLTSGNTGSATRQSLLD